VFRYIIRRLIAGVITLLVVTLVTFGIFFMVPKLTGTDPALLYIGKQADKVAVEGARKKMGLDKPVLEQYGLFVKGIVAGRDYDNGPDKTHCSAPCFGYSFKNQFSVWQRMLSDLPVTASLAIGAAIVWLILGIGAGVVSALRKGRIVDRAVMTGALAGVSLPIYFTGLLSASIFVYTLHWLPAPGYTSFLTNPFTWAQGLILPWITLAFLFAATYARLTRATMLETLGEDYIRTARAKGLRESRVVAKHALRSTLTPITTVFGLDLGALLGGAILTERVFNLNGLGKDAVLAISTSDLPVILGVTMFAAFFIVIANLIVDVLYGVIDPRVRLA
jgi:peptide/nickel transport system permease protein